MKIKMTFLDANLNELKTKVFNMNEEKQSFLRSSNISDLIQNEYEENKNTCFLTLELNETSELICVTCIDDLVPNIQAQTVIKNKELYNFLLSETDQDTLNAALLLPTKNPTPLDCSYIEFIDGTIESVDIESDIKSLVVSGDKIVLSYVNSENDKTFNISEVVKIEGSSILCKDDSDVKVISFSFRFNSSENFKKYHDDFRKELEKYALLRNS